MPMEREHPRHGKVPQWPKDTYHAEILPNESIGEAATRLQNEGHENFLIWPIGKKGEGSPLGIHLTTKKKEAK